MWKIKLFKSSSKHIAIFFSLWELLAQLTRDQKGRDAQGIVQFLSAQNQREHLLNCHQAEVWLQPSPTLAFSQLQAGFADCSPRHADDFVPHPVWGDLCANKTKQQEKGSCSSAGELGQQWQGADLTHIDLFLFILPHLLCSPTKEDADFISQRAFLLALQKDVATRTWSTHVTYSLSAPVSAWWGKEFRCHVAQPPQSLIIFGLKQPKENRNTWVIHAQMLLERKQCIYPKIFLNPKLKICSLSSTKTHNLFKLQRACNRKFTLISQFLTASKFGLSLSRSKTPPSVRDRYNCPHY